MHYSNALLCLLLLAVIALQCAAKKKTAPPTAQPLVTKTYSQKSQMHVFIHIYILSGMELLILVQ
jgi:hypothetical protein